MLTDMQRLERMLALRRYEELQSQLARVGMFENTGRERGGMRLVRVSPAYREWKRLHDRLRIEERGFLDGEAPSTWPEILHRKRPLWRSPAYRRAVRRLRNACNGPLPFHA